MRFTAYVNPQMCQLDAREPTVGRTVREALTGGRRSKDLVIN